MNENTALIICQTDFQLISSLLRDLQSETVDLLKEELGRATIVTDEELPKNVVAMNTSVKFQNLETKKETLVELVYPQEANISDNRISILSPIGSALIGLRIGQSISWPIPNGKVRKLKIISVTSNRRKL